MTETILVPIDGSEPANSAMEFALSRFPDAHVIVYHSVNPVSIAREAESGATRPEFWAEEIEEAKSESEEILDEIETRVDGTDAEVEVDAEVGPPTQNIVDYAEQRDVDQIVMGSRGRSGLTRVALGSVAEQVVRRSPVPVTIVHGDESS